MQHIAYTVNKVVNLNAFRKETIQPQGEDIYTRNPPSGKELNGGSCCSLKHAEAK